MENSSLIYKIVKKLNITHQHIKGINGTIYFCLLIWLGFILGWKVAVIIFLLAWSHNIEKHWGQW